MALFWGKDMVDLRGGVEKSVKTRCRSKYNVVSWVSVVSGFAGPQVQGEGSEGNVLHCSCSSTWHPAFPQYYGTVAAP
ncbi:MAG: hypothetical protein AAF597_07205 [Bacteroidota bacterium]